MTTNPLTMAVAVIAASPEAQRRLCDALIDLLKRPKAKGKA